MRASAARIEQVRRFNRFYTRTIGVLDEGLLQSRFSLTEVRVLYELAQPPQTTATELRRALGLDAGYLSRMLQRFRRHGLVQAAAGRDARQQRLALTAAGRRAFAPLDQRARAQVAALLAPLDAAAQARLVGALRTVEKLLGAAPPSEPVTWHIRGVRPGDLGWVVERHGAVYAAEHGWDVEFEKLVARIVGDFDGERDRGFIADIDGERVGSVFVVQESKAVARLRLLLVEPQARGLGIGARLVEECVRHARGAGYKRLELWTQSVLVAARRIYEGAGFRLVREKKHHTFGHDLVAQDWSLTL